MSVVLGADDAGIAAAAAALRGGELVAFPTETVYGLGANALNEASVLRIFEVKGRPLSDPLIVHVADKGDALRLADLQGDALKIFHVLADAFWPGALTMVVPAAPQVPAMLGAGTGTVGLRCPSHALARRLIAEAGVPVAAPSANRFGHTSPTRASHVLDDLRAADIFVLDGDGSASAAAAAAAAAAAPSVCENGIESTVCRVDEAARKLLVYRAGAVSPPRLERALAAAGLGAYAVDVVVRHAKVHVPGKDATPAAAADGGGAPNTGAAVAEEGGSGLVAPGQILTHYAPDVTTFLVRPAGAGDGATAALPAEVQLGNAVVLDIGGRLGALRDVALHYRDLAEADTGAGGDGWTPCRWAASHLFEALRHSETVDGASCVLLPLLPADAAGSDEYQLGVADRMFRAASGREVALESVLALLRESER